MNICVLLKEIILILSLTFNSMGAYSFSVCLFVCLFINSSMQLLLGRQADTFQIW